MSTSLLMTFILTLVILIVTEHCILTRITMRLKEISKSISALKQRENESQKVDSINDT